MTNDKPQTTFSFEEIDAFPKKLLFQLSSEPLRFYAAELRSRHRKTLNLLKQARDKQKRTDEALFKARGACKRFRESSL